ncbi:MAG: DUF3604 domain-containing protein [Kiritimatiellales bacterium]|nr:DUF3604 domain-containing protein [Kiritimatiellales bacterium]MCF7863440.1 DUF3604 domain-containing protein [Kiritimatiellales bacterium]
MRANKIDASKLLWVVAALGFSATSVQAGASRPADEVGGLKSLQAEFAGKGHLEAYERCTRGLGKGSVELDCSEETVRPGMKVEWVKAVYTAAEPGIAPGGSVTLSTPPGPAESSVQIEDPAEPAFMEVATGSNVPCSTELDYPPFELQEHCLVRLLLVKATFPEGLPAGETVTFTWHNVVVDNHARRWGGDSWRFRFFADHDGDGWKEELPEVAGLPKKTGPAESLLVRCASMAVIGEPVRIAVSAFDRLGNPAQEYEGEVRFALADGGEGTLPEAYSFEKGDQGSHTFSATFSKPGFYWVSVTDNAGHTNRSNPIEIFEKEPTQRLYWGDIHVHTEKSADARVWAHTTSTYPGSYKIGRYRYGLDFQANSDHHGVRQGNYLPAEWEEMKEITNQANDPGRFVTLIGMELSHAEGDANAYFKGDDAPFFDHPMKNHPVELYKELKKYTCFLPPHHFAQNMRPYDWDKNYDPVLSPVCEIFSNHGRAEYLHNEPHYSGKKIPTMEGKTWVEQLQTGKKLGCIANSDDHWARPGTCGLTGAWSQTFTREGIYDAIAGRHCYATTGDRTILYFTVNGAEGGQTIPAVANPKIHIRAAAGSLIEKLEVVKNGAVVYSAEPHALTVEVDWTDPAEPSACWYYVRLTVKAQEICEEYMRNKTQFVWTSPVWVEGPERNN